MFNISFRRVGGINFLKLGRITIMWCVSRELKARSVKTQLPIYDGLHAPSDHVTNEHNCAMGLHSWCDEVGVLPPDTPCAHCGETYGFVTKRGNPYSGEIRW